jgi:hypothetical protein
MNIQNLGVEMKLVRGKNIVAVLFLLLVATGLLLSKTYAGVPRLMSPGDFTVPSDTRYVGDVFNVTITVADVQHLYSWQVKLLFNNTILNCTGIAYPPVHIFSGHAIIPVDPIIDNIAGSALTGSSLVGVDYVNVTGVGNVINFEFEALATGTSLLNFSRPYGGDTFLIDDTIQGNIINVTLVDGNIDVIVPEFNVPALTFLFMFTTLIIMVVARKALPKTVRVTAPYTR